MSKILFMPEYKFGETTEKIIGSSFKVHGILCNGFQEVMSAGPGPGPCTLDGAIITPPLT